MIDHRGRIGAAGTDGRDLRREPLVVEPGGEADGLGGPAGEAAGDGLAVAAVEALAGRLHEERPDHGLAARADQIDREGRSTVMAAGGRGGSGRGRAGPRDLPYADDLGRGTE